MNKLLIGAIGISLLITATGWFSYNAGVNSERAAAAKIIAKYQAKQRKIVEELEEAKQNREIVYDTKIKIVKEAADPTGCADTVIPTDILQQLSASSPAK